ncbi:hypothetical protein [Kitasatospora sp. McL0602]|uniref:hypothetical protein n=1 Tax=Kitasatospora sp. McL0602 TaxID=3439530 RepID=UPI003F88C952
MTDGIMQPAKRWPDANLRTPAEIRQAGELADLIEAHLGPVRSSGDVDGPRVGMGMGMGTVWSRSLLLVTSDWATVLFLGLDD